jgi:hypothetical protein
MMVGTDAAWDTVVVGPVSMEEVAGVITVAGLTALSGDAEALNTGLVASRASTLLSSSALVSESEEEEGRRISGRGCGVEITVKVQWIGRVSRD